MTKRRWYDYNKHMAEFLVILQRLPVHLREDLALNIINFANIVRKNNQESEIELPISIGKNKVLGLYKSFKRRRWYDKNLTLMTALNVLATLPQEDFEKIAEGVLSTVKELKI
ncbi:MAG: hypothetical protein WC197_06160 [Candidatus Gastranaerophilaceae bacterium]|jgi:hypothetical protein